MIEDGTRVSPGASAEKGASPLPADMTYRDLPGVPPLWRVVGPGVVLLALAAGSGEFVLWPFVASRAGLGLLWVALVGIVTQYFVNMEIERYTLATGETAVTGFARLWRPWSWIFVVLTAVPWVWPAWSAGAATTAGFLFGWDTQTIDRVTVLGLISIGIALTVPARVYMTVERLQMAIVGLIMLFLLIAILAVTDVGTWAGAIGEIGYRDNPDLPAGLVFSALVFAGAGGTLNLTLSNWIRDKGMGMGAHVPRIESPLIAHASTQAPRGHTIRIDDVENLARWRGWWRVANREQLLTFVLGGFLIIVGFSAISASTVFGTQVGSGFDFIRLEGEALARQVGPWLRGSFWVMGAVMLFSTNLGILDHMGRVLADIMKANWLRESHRWTESRLYGVVIWTEIIVGSLIVLFAIDAPMTLLVLAAALNGLVMLVYSVLLIRLNRVILQGPIRIHGLRVGAMAWAVALYGGFTFYLLWSGVGAALEWGGG